MLSVLLRIVLVSSVLSPGAVAAENPGVSPDRRSCQAQQGSGVPASRLAALARGFNLPGWLDRATPRPPDLTVLASLRARGFTHIRLPVGAERLMPELSTPAEMAGRLAELDRAIDQLLRLDFAVTLDIHPGERFSRLHVAEPDRALGYLEALWRRLGQRYSHRSPERLFLEALNEPTVDRKLWNAQGPRLVDAIRRAAPHHTIIYGHADYQRIDALAELSPLADGNVVYAAHFYDPMIFTHQGLDWSDDPLRHLRNIPFPARLHDPPIVRLLDELARKGRNDAAALVKSGLREPWNEDRVDAEIARAAAWAERHRRPVVINEFGVLGWKTEPSDRVRWLRAVRSAAERHCIGWTHWDYADGFGFVRRVAEREIPDETIVRALLHAKPISPAMPRTR
jgi:endoglucanase